MLPPYNISVPELSNETGIPKDTLYGWRCKHRKTTGNGVLKLAFSNNLCSEEKFAVVVESAGLNEAELSEYCRRKGLYPAQINEWRASCEQANASAANKLDQTKLKAQAKQIKQLEAELSRKEKALAEAAALLVLQKKIQALWGDPEDEK